MVGVVGLLGRRGHEDLYDHSFTGLADGLAHEVQDVGAVLVFALAWPDAHDADRVGVFQALPLGQHPDELAQVLQRRLDAALGV